MSASHPNPESGCERDLVTDQRLFCFVYLMSSHGWLQMTQLWGPISIMSLIQPCLTLVRPSDREGSKVTRSGTITRLGEPINHSPNHPARSQPHFLSGPVRESPRLSSLRPSGISLPVASLAWPGGLNAWDPGSCCISCLFSWVLFSTQ